MTFNEFNFKKPLQKALDEIGFKEPSPIQEQAIPLILEGNDIIAQAHTGTGKTAAFALPILQMLEVDGSVEALVIVPTRELAMQVSDEIFRFGKHLGIRTATVYGGSSYSRQLHHIENASVIIATPGRLIDLLKSKKINISPKFVVLDEADEMLDMGFLDDIKEIFSFLPKNRQTMMFSATMPNDIKILTQEILKNPKIVSIMKNSATNENIQQQYYVIEEWERDEALIRLLDYFQPHKSIIFCRMKKEVDRVNDMLLANGFNSKGLHGDMDQRQRENVIKAFKTNNLDILVATDVAARGLDVNDVDFVFNYHLPFDRESYVHRIGRTGRAGKEGVAISLVTPGEFKALSAIQKAVGDKLINNIIPTIDKVKDKKIQGFIDQILNQEIVEQSYIIFDAIKESLSKDELILKLISMVYNGKKVKGKNIIGKNKKEVLRLFENFKRSSKRKRKPRTQGRRRR